MLKSNINYLEPELMDVVRLFSGAETLEIQHTFTQGHMLRNAFCIDGCEYVYEDEH